MSRDIQYLMVLEMDADEFQAFKQDWQEKWDDETGDLFDRYMGQEGHTGRDESIAMYRDDLYQRNKSRVKDGRIEDIIVDHDYGHVMFGTRFPNQYWIWDLAGMPLRRITDPVNYLRLWSNDYKAKRLQERLDARNSQ